MASPADLHNRRSNSRPALCRQQRAPHAVMTHGALSNMRPTAKKHRTVFGQLDLYRSKTRRRSVTCGSLSSGSGRSVLFVDHTAEYAMASDQAVEGQGGWSVLVVGGSLVESLVRPVGVVVPGVLEQGPGGVVFVGDQDVVGALVVDGAHEPLGVTVRSGSSWRCRDDRDVFAAEHGVEAGGERGVSIADRKRNELIRSPRSMARVRAV
jgi:hypothetical protein